MQDDNVSRNLRILYLVDHKPNMPSELQRIQASGGSLVWLHGNKAYIRGGDFIRRQANGEHPKQLNYSRAFGGKDLKVNKNMKKNSLVPFITLKNNSKIMF